MTHDIFSRDSKCFELVDVRRTRGHQCAQRKKPHSPPGCQFQSRMLCKFYNFSSHYQLIKSSLLPFTKKKKKWPHHHEVTSLFSFPKRSHKKILIHLPCQQMLNQTAHNLTTSAETTFKPTNLPLCLLEPSYMIWRPQAPQTAAKFSPWSLQISSHYT